MKRKGIIFDLDGTLWEVIDRTYESANEIAKKYQLKEISRDTICSVFGLNKDDASKKYFPDLEFDKALELINEVMKLNIEKLKKFGGNIYPDVEETIIKLKENYDLFIVSNTSEIEYIEAFLNTSNLGKYFSDYIASGKLNTTKAESIKKIINDYQLDNSIYVGDTLKDKEAAELACIPFVHAKYGFCKELNTKYYINQIKELIDIVDIIL